MGILQCNCTETGDGFVHIASNLGYVYHLVSWQGEADRECVSVRKVMTGRGSRRKWGSRGGGGEGGVDG